MVGIGLNDRLTLNNWTSAGGLSTAYPIFNKDVYIDIKWHKHAAYRRLIYRFHWNIATGSNLSNGWLIFCPNVEINSNSYIYIHHMLFWSTCNETVLAQVNCSITTTTNVRLLQVSDSKTISQTIRCSMVMEWIAIEFMHAQQVGLVVGEVNTIIGK